MSCLKVWNSQTSRRVRLFIQCPRALETYRSQRTKLLTPHAAACKKFGQEAVVEQKSEVL